MSADGHEALPDRPEIPEHLAEQTLTPMQAWAIEVREHFEALRAARFTSSQAMDIIRAGTQAGWFDGHTECCLPTAHDAEDA